MMKELQSLVSLISSDLHMKNSIYSVTDKRYDEYITFSKKHEALLNILPLNHMNTFHLFEAGRDLYFHLTIPSESLIENQSYRLIFVTRFTLIQYITKLDSFLQMSKKINGNKELAFIYSTMIINILAQIYNLIPIAKSISLDIMNILKFKNVDLRSLFLEEYTLIEPYPKKIAMLNQQLAKAYLQFFKVEATTCTYMLKQAATDCYDYYDIISVCQQEGASSCQTL